jgi:putrescine aminotransferase
MKHDDVLNAYREHLNPNNAAFLERVGLDCAVEEASGALIHDQRGREFIDFVAGYGIFNLGHNPPRVVAALKRELEGRPLWGRPFLNEPLAELAAKLAEISPGDLSRVFLCSTGAEAVESAIKLARLATRRDEIVAAKGAFHGFTMGALSASGIPGQSRPFKPLLPGFKHVPFGDAEALEGELSDNTAAVLLEPYQAEVGAATPPDGYLKNVRDICDRAGVLLIVDEVRTGIGRTGPVFAVELEDVTPDVLVVGKSLADVTPDVLVVGKSLAGGIVPIGAILARTDIWGRFGLSFSMSASSFAGNRLACVSALAALSTLEEDGVLDAGRRAADALWPGLEKLVEDYPDLVVRLTGKGMLVGVHLTNNRVADDVVTRTIAGGLLTGTAFCNGRCILIEPPLVVSPGDVDRGIEIFRSALDEVSTSQRD